MDVRTRPSQGKRRDKRTSRLAANVLHSSVRLATFSCKTAGEFAAVTWAESAPAAASAHPIEPQRRRHRITHTIFKKLSTLQCSFLGSNVPGSGRAGSTFGGFMASQPR